ncbi:MAG: Uma2 family endonuclease [Spirulinaceae cyanobacterium SM2_1_0]|nr:Uma2 family endonuclease [Spirulinaceae cyanobacterium SM2_1_0]
MSLTFAKWSLADYHRLVATDLLADRAVELLAGDIVEMPPEGPEHAQLSTDTVDRLRQLLGDRALIRDGKPITLPTLNSEPQPDLAIVQPQRARYRQQHPQPDDIFWLIEYTNTSLSKDRDVKRKLYAQASIPAYWLVDLQNRQVYDYREPQAGDYQQVEILTTGAIALPHFPELRITVAQLLTGEPSD